MNLIDPEVIWKRLVADIPNPVHKNIHLTGSLAAGYHFRDALATRGVYTKDANVVVQPSGDASTIAQIAAVLRSLGWKWRLEDVAPGDASKPLNALPSACLYPPGRGPSYWLDFQMLPKTEQAEPVDWFRVVVGSEHFAVPAFRFASLTAQGLKGARPVLRYADPAMTALANLLSHPEVGFGKMTTTIEGMEYPRSAKDLGLVLAIAYLDTSEEIAGWVDSWTEALRTCFPRSWRGLGARTGDGLRALLQDNRGWKGAHRAAANGLLSGKGVTREALFALAQQFLSDLVEPFERRCTQA